MCKFVSPALMILTFWPLATRGQDTHRPSGAQPARSTLVLKLKQEAGKLDGPGVSPLFLALTDAKARSSLDLTDRQCDLAGRLDELTRDVLKAWLLRDLDAAIPPSLDVLEQRLSGLSEVFRARIVNHAEALALGGLLTPEQARALREAMGRKAVPLLKGRFGPPTVWIPDDNMSAIELAAELQQRARSYSRAGSVFRAVLGRPELEEFLDPKTKAVPPKLPARARRFMPSVEVPKESSDLVDRLDRVTLDIFRAWLTRDLEKTPLPTGGSLRQRLVDYPSVVASLSAHAEAIALEAILTAQQADRCLRSVWREQGARALLDPALAARLRLSRSQREEILSVLGEKDRISDEQTEAQAPLIGLIVSRPELRALDEQIANDGKIGLDQADGLIWDSLTSAQVRILSQIMGVEKRPSPRPVAKSKRPSRRSSATPR